MNSILCGAIVNLFFAFVAAENDTTTVKIATEGTTEAIAIENASTSTQGIVEFISTVKATEVYINPTEKVTIDTAGATKDDIENATSDVQKITDYIPIVNETEAYLNETKEVTIDTANTAKEIIKNVTSSGQQIADLIPSVNETKAYLNETKQVTIDAANTVKEIFKNTTSNIKGRIDNIPASFNKTEKVNLEVEGTSTKKPIYEIPHTPNTRVVTLADGKDAVVRFTVKNWYASEKASIYFSITYAYAGNETESKSEIIPKGKSETVYIPAAATDIFFRVWYITHTNQVNAAFGHDLKVADPRYTYCFEVCNSDLPIHIGVPLVEFCSNTACGKII